MILKSPFQVYALQKGGYPEKALTVMHKLVRDNPKDINLLLYMSRVLGEQSKHADAIVYLSAASKLALENKDMSMLGELHFQTANHHKDLGQSEDAIYFYLKTLEINDRNVDAHINLGAFYQLQVGEQYCQNATHNMIRAFSSI